MAQRKRARNVRASRAKRWIYLQGEITAATATNFEKHLVAFAKEKSGPITVFLESSGGDTFACLKIYHLIMAYREKNLLVHTAGRGAVKSGAFFILQAGARRFAAETATFMFHRSARTYKDERMNSSDLAEEVNFLNKIDAMQLIIYTKRGRPIRKIEELFSRDATISARQAQKLKLVDVVIADENPSQIRSAVAN